METSTGNTKSKPTARQQVSPVAASVRTDFFQLVRIFEQQLQDGGNLDNSTRAAISDAKAAAERGLSLSNALLEFLQSSIDQE